MRRPVQQGRERKALCKREREAREEPVPKLGSGHSLRRLGRLNLWRRRPRLGSLDCGRRHGLHGLPVLGGQLLLLGWNERARSRSVSQNYVERQLARLDLADRPVPRGLLMQVFGSVSV